MPRNDGARIQVAKLLQRLDPLAGVAVVDIRKWMHDEIARDHNVFLWQVGDSVARRVAASQELDLDFSVAEVDGEVVVEGQRGALEDGFFELRFHFGAAS